MVIPIEEPVSIMDDWKNLIPLISGFIGALIGSLVAFINTRLTVGSKRVEEKKNEISYRSNDFVDMQKRGNMYRPKTYKNIFNHKHNE